MKVELDLEKNICTVTKEKGDKKFKPSGWGNLNCSESGFLYKVKQALQDQGHDVIKKRMWNDGHMVAEYQQYIRTRNRNTGFMLWNNHYAISGLGDDFNRLNVGESLEIQVERY